MPIRLGMDYEKFGEEPPKYPRFMANRPVTSMGAPTADEGIPLLPEVAEKVIGYKGAPPDQVQKSPGFLQSIYRKIQGIDPRVKAGILGTIGEPRRGGGFLSGLEAGAAGYARGTQGYDNSVRQQMAMMSKAELDRTRGQAAETTANASMTRANAYDRWVDKERKGAMTIQEKARMWMGMSPEEKEAYRDMARDTRPRTAREENEDQFVKTIRELAYEASGYDMSEYEARVLARAKPSLMSTTTSIEKRDEAGRKLAKDDPNYRKTFPQMVNRRQFALPGIVKSILKRAGLREEDFYSVAEGYQTPEDVFPTEMAGGEADSSGVAFQGAEPDSVVINESDEITGGPTSREEVMQTDDVQLLYDWMQTPGGLTEEQVEWIDERLGQILLETSPR